MKMRTALCHLRAAQFRRQSHTKEITVLGQLSNNTATVAKLLRLLTSNVDGEVLGAVRALHRTVGRAGIFQLADIVENLGKTSDVVPIERPWWQLLAGELLAESLAWGSRERAFLETMVRTQCTPTARQQKWLRDIQSRRAA